MVRDTEDVGRLGLAFTGELSLGEAAACVTKFVELEVEVSDALSAVAGRLFGTEATVTRVPVGPEEDGAGGGSEGFGGLSKIVLETLEGRRLAFIACRDGDTGAP